MVEFSVFCAHSGVGWPWESSATEKLPVEGLLLCHGNARIKPVVTKLVSSLSHGRR